MNIKTIVGEVPTGVKMAASAEHVQWRVEDGREDG